MAKIFSIQDGNLQNRPITTSIPRTYSDIDCSFETKTSPKGDIFLKKDAAAVAQSVKNLLMTNHGEVPFRPYYGGNLNDILFELADDLEADDIQSMVTEAIERFEPRATVKSVISQFKPDYNSVDITITFNIINLQREVTLNVTIARTR